MALESRGRKLSFDILSATTMTSVDDDDIESLLYRSTSDSLRRQNGEGSEVSATESKLSRRKRKNKGSRKKKRTLEFSISEKSVLDDPMHGVLQNGSCRGESKVNCKSYSVQSVVCEEVTVSEESERSSCTSCTVGEVESQNVETRDGYLVGELRQRSVAGGGGGANGGAVSRIDETPKEESGTKEVDSSSWKNRSESNGNVFRKLETAESLDWKQLMAQDPNHVFSTEKSPVMYFMEEMYNGNSLRSTTTLGTDKERERVYDTIFRLPWRCELLIDVGLFVCLDSFLSLLTIMPTRILMTFWRLIKMRTWLGDCKDTRVPFGTQTRDGRGSFETFYKSEGQKIN